MTGYSFPEALSESSGRTYLEEDSVGCVGVGQRREVRRNLLARTAPGKEPPQSSFSVRIQPLQRAPKPVEHAESQLTTVVFAAHNTDEKLSLDGTQRFVPTDFCSIIVCVPSDLAEVSKQHFVPGVLVRVGTHHEAVKSATTSR